MSYMDIIDQVGVDLNIVLSNSFSLLEVIYLVIISHEKLTKIAIR